MSERLQNDETILFKQMGPPAQHRQPYVVAVGMIWLALASQVSALGHCQKT